MNEELENNEGLEGEESSDFMGYEELMEAKKISFIDIKEHMTGPVISTILHVILLAFLGTIIVFEAPEKGKEITVEVKTIEPTEIEPPPPPPEPPEPVDVEVETDTPVETPNMEVEVDVQIDNISVENPNPIDMPSMLNMKMSNSALRLSVPMGGGRKGGGSSRGLGYGSRVEGDLTGIMYDLKTTPTNAHRSHSYWSDVQKYIDSGLKYNKELGFRQMKKKLFNSHFYIPKMEASEGPKQFGLEGEMQPQGFFVHYTGSINAKSKFRFSGTADDMIIVLLNNKIVFDGSWGHQMSNYTKEDSTKYNAFIGWPSTFGNWVNPGKYKIDILFGERPGGVMGAILLVQEQNKTYPQASGGRPILPIFTTQKLNKEEKQRIESESWKIATDGPVMAKGGKIKVKKEKAVTGLTIQ